MKLFIRLVYNGGDTYDGNWVNGMASGFGKATWKDGSYYEG